MDYFAVIKNENDMVDALTGRRQQLDLTQEQVEHDVNLAHGHLGKIEHGVKSWGKRVFRLTGSMTDPLKLSQTFEWLLEMYGLKLVIVDQETAALLEREVKIQTRRHRKKLTREAYPNLERMQLQISRRPRQDAQPCGAFYPEPIKSASPSEPSVKPCEKRKAKA